MAADETAMTNELSDDAHAAPLKGLSERQLAVLQLMLAGRSNNQICRELNLAMGTVKGHIASVLRITGTTNRADA